MVRDDYYGFCRVNRTQKRSSFRVYSAPCVWKDDYVIISAQVSRNSAISGTFRIAGGLPCASRARRETSGDEDVSMSDEICRSDKNN